MKLLLFTILIYAQTCFARLYFEDATSPELITSARALAMGNSYSSLVDDSMSAFYNPAGLGTVRRLSFHLTNIHFEFSNGFLDATSGSGNFFNAFSKYSEAFTSEGVRDLLADNPGMTHARFNLFPNFTYRWITIGYMYSQQQRARLESLSSDFEIAERQDSGPVAAVAFSLFGGIVKVGASAVYLTRKEVFKDTAQNLPVEIEKEDYSRATMTHITASTRITFPIKYLPTISIVSRNASEAQWGNEDLAGAPEDIPRTTDISASITPILSRGSRIHIEVGARDLGNRYENVPAARKIQGGLEWNYRRSIFVRAGYGDGWGSGGIGIRTRNMVFDISTYAVEASEDGYREDEDRRFALNLASGF
jgi:hypothetical protein